MGAVAYLLRSEGWGSLVEAASAALASQTQTDEPPATRKVEQLRRQVEALTENSKWPQARHHEKLVDVNAENADLRHKLGDARGRLRQAVAAAAAAGDEVADPTSTWCATS